MDELERKLRETLLATPPGQFDANMQRLFATATLRRPAVWRAKFALWQCAAACAVCLEFGYLLHAYMEPPRAKSEPVRAVYMIPADVDLRGIFDATPKPPKPAADTRKYEVRVYPAESAVNTQRSL